MKAHVGADAQLREFLTSTVELKEYLYAPVANSRYLLGTWLCMYYSPAGRLNGEETSDSYQESNPDFSVFLPAAYTQSKNEVRYEVMDKTNTVSIPERDKIFLYSQSIEINFVAVSSNIGFTFFGLKWPVISSSPYDRP
jgi:hypothetical protein